MYPIGTPETLDSCLQSTVLSTARACFFVCTHGFLLQCTGLPKENDWVLYGPEADATLGFRNLIAYTLSRGMGRYASRLKYCELFLVQDGKPLNKNHYNGLYLLAEKVKRGENRVDISKQKEDDLSGTAAQG